MANIKNKNLEDLSGWNAKELRKLRMLLKNRISTLEVSSKPKDLAASHPLAEMEIHDCRDLLVKVVRAEKGE